MQGHAHLLTVPIGMFKNLNSKIVHFMATPSGFSAAKSATIDPIVPHSFFHGYHGKAPIWNINELGRVLHPSFYHTL